MRSRGVFRTGYLNIVGSTCLNSPTQKESKAASSILNLCLYSCNANGVESKRECTSSSNTDRTKCRGTYIIAGIVMSRERSIITQTIIFTPSSPPIIYCVVLCFIIGRLVLSSSRSIFCTLSNISVPSCKASGSSIGFQDGKSG